MGFPQEQDEVSADLGLPANPACACGCRANHPGEAAIIGGKPGSKGYGTRHYVVTDAAGKVLAGALRSKVPDFQFRHQVFWRVGRACGQLRRQPWARTGH